MPAAEELSALPDRDLRMMLVEWKRWRTRVLTAPVMRQRRERFEEAVASIAAIEQELALREPGERIRQQRRVRTALAEIASGPTVSLGEYRGCRATLARIDRRRAR